MSPRHSDKLCSDCIYYRESRHSGAEFARCAHPAVRTLVNAGEGDYCATVREDAEGKYLCGRIGFWWEPKSPVLAAETASSLPRLLRALGWRRPFA